MMTERECYRRIALFQKADYIPNYEAAPERLIRRWKREGMPADADYREYFGLLTHPRLFRGISFGPIPGVPDRDRGLPEMPGCNVGCDPWGRIAAWHPKDDVEDEYAEGAFIEIAGGLQTREEWERIRDHFQPDLDARYPDDWPELLERWRDRETVLVLEGPSMVGALRLHLGFENYCLKLYDDRAMIEEIMDARTELALAILPRALDEGDFDMLWFWEDCAFRNGPILSPEIFEQIATPRYRRLADWYRSRGGEIVAVDSDGDVRPLIPGWIRGGINHIWPLEPFAGVDVVALRREYGQAFSMRGGVDKFCVGKGREAIDRELDRVFPVVQDGGFIPHLDHMLPDCSFDDYCYYIERKRRMLESV
jgi:uroporphyrinogen decarboxylase